MTIKRKVKPSKPSKIKAKAIQYDCGLGFCLEGSGVDKADFASRAKTVQTAIALAIKGCLPKGWSVSQPILNSISKVGGIVND